MNFPSGDQEHCKNSERFINTALWKFKNSLYACSPETID